MLIQLEPQEVSSAKLSSSIIRMLGDGIDVRRVEFVGPKVGEELTNDGGLSNALCANRDSDLCCI